MRKHGLEKCAANMPEFVNLHDGAAADLGQMLPVLAHVQQVLCPYTYFDSFSSIT